MKNNIVNYKTMNTNVTTDNKNQKGFDLNWPNVIKYTIIAIIILGTLKLITQIFTSLSPLLKGLGDALGASVNIVNGITNNCKKQQNCSDISTQEICEKLDTCIWNPPKKAGENGECIPITGQKEGSGGFFSTQCGLGIGFIAYLASLIFVPFIKILGALLTRNQNVETAGRLNGKGTVETLKDVINESVRDGEAIKKGLQKEATELTPEMERLIGAKAANNRSTNEVINNIKEQIGAHEYIQSAMDNHAEIEMTVIKRAKEEGVDMEDIEKIESKVEEQVEVIHPLMSKMIEFNVTPTPQTLAYIMDKTKKKISNGKSINRQHMIFLKKIM